MEGLQDEGPSPEVHLGHPGAPAAVSPSLASLTAAEGEVRDSAEYDDIYRDGERHHLPSPVLQCLLEGRKNLLQPRG